MKMAKFEISTRSKKAASKLESFLNQMISEKIRILKVERNVYYKGSPKYYTPVKGATVIVEYEEMTSPSYPKWVDEEFEVQCFHCKGKKGRTVKKKGRAWAFCSSCGAALDIVNRVK